MLDEYTRYLLFGWIALYLVHGEQCVPLLEEFVQVVRHFHLGLRHLVAEGETWDEL